jgi:acyl-coenzyme A thioesterase 13
LVDVVGTIAIMTADRDHRPGVSTDLNISWFAPVPKGEHVLVEATVLKTGRTLAFVCVDLRRESDNVLAAQGRMTKALGSPAPA